MFVFREICHRIELCLFDRRILLDQRIVFDPHGPVQSKEMAGRMLYVKEPKASSLTLVSLERTLRR